jgi:hypothetical protein
MPAVVQDYYETGDLISCQRIQRAIIDTYQDDFGKYSRKLKHRYLDKIYNAVPKMVGRKFVYAHVDNTIKSRELKISQAPYDSKDQIISLPFIYS